MTSGVAKSLTHSAVQDNDKKTWLYTVTVALDRPRLNVDGHDVLLTPGMTATVDIRTGNRRVIEYVLSPVIEHAKESMNER
jgi:hemolysin D